MNNTYYNKYIIVLFDGECGFCNYWIQWILRQKPAANMKFTSLQSEIGREILSDNNINFDLKTIIVVHQGELLHKSMAIKYILKNLSSPARFYSNVLQVVPKIISDSVYDLAAKHRLKFINNNNICNLPTPEQKKHFIL